MNKINIIISIIAVLLLTLVSFSNVVGYNTIKTSQEEIIVSEYSFDECKEYLFQTIIDISENPEIKDIIQDNYQPQRTMLPFRRSNFDLKVEHLELLYEMGLKMMDRLGEDKISELMENIEIPEYADDLDAIIMGNDELCERIYTLNEMNNEGLSPRGFEDYPILCFVFALMFVIVDIIIVSFIQPVFNYFIKNDLTILYNLLLLIYYPIMFVGVLGIIGLVVFCIDIPYLY